MPTPTKQTESKTTTARRAYRIGCVEYLNAKPLIEGLEGLTDPVVSLDVPAALILELERGEVDIALCPVIDYYRCKQPLVIVPVGCIASDGPTMTVRLFSRVPIPSLTVIHADNDSHTSVTLLRVLLNRLHDLQPKIIPFDARKHSPAEQASDAPQAMLLIGDKVVNNAPSSETYPHQMDLGEAWKALTGMPFVFAIWMAREGENLRDLPGILDRQRECNAVGIEAIAAMYALDHGWEPRAAQHYLGHVLSYRVGAQQIQAIERFASEAKQLGLIQQAQPLRMYAPGK